jgi:hypothetical protein
MIRCLVVYHLSLVLKIVDLPDRSAQTPKDMWGTGLTRLDKVPTD